MTVVSNQGSSPTQHYDPITELPRTTTKSFRPRMAISRCCTEASSGQRPGVPKCAGRNAVLTILEAGRWHGGRKPAGYWATHRMLLPTMDEGRGPSHCGRGVRRAVIASTYFLVPAAATAVTGLICVGSGQSRPARHLFAPGGERSLSAQLPPSVQRRR